MFRRRRAVDDDALGDNLDGDLDDFADDPDHGTGAESGDGVTEQAATAPAGGASGAGAEGGPAPNGTPRRPQGPWDAEDAPDDELLDLGGLRVPIVDGFDVSITAEEDVPVLVTYAAQDGLMQLHAFAAPRSSGIWAEVRTEIADSLQQGGGRATEAEGPFGTELSATIPVQTPEGSTVMQPARFVGVDGPRWFLRALLTGPIVGNRSRVQVLEEVIRRVVVVRGGDAMAPRDVIPLRLPRELLAAAEAAAAEADADGDEMADDGADAGDAGERPRLSMPQRGPEITEVR